MKQTRITDQGLPFQRYKDGSIFGERRLNILSEDILGTFIGTKMAKKLLKGRLRQIELMWKIPIFSHQRISQRAVRTPSRSNWTSWVQLLLEGVHNRISKETYCHLLFSRRAWTTCPPTLYPPMIPVIYRKEQAFLTTY